MLDFFLFFKAQWVSYYADMVRIGDFILAEVTHATIYDNLIYHCNSLLVSSYRLKSLATRWEYWLSVCGTAAGVQF